MRRLAVLAVILLLLAGIAALRPGEDAPAPKPAPKPAPDRAKPAPAPPVTAARRFTVCHHGGGRNCVVDGDTFWMDGVKIRIIGIDTPETHEFKCPAEAALGVKARDRLRALLNAGPVTLTARGRDADRNGRKLRDVAVNGRDVDDVLIAEGLARRYRGRKESWC